MEAEGILNVATSYDHLSRISDMLYPGLLYAIYLPIMVLAYLSIQYSDTWMIAISEDIIPMFTDIDQTDLHRSEPSSRT